MQTGWHGQFGKVGGKVETVVETVVGSVVGTVGSVTISCGTVGSTHGGHGLLHG